MADILLSTKLSLPPVRKDLVVRPDLIDRLNAGLERKLTLLSTPAGFGKTTLLAVWASQCNLPVAWLSLDEGDNDPARFLGYLQAALNQAGIETPPLQGERLPALLELYSWLSESINQVAAFKHNLALVLDDYHVITAEPVHAVLTFLLEHQPVNLHLFIATRADPPLPLPRLRGRGQLVEFHLTDLRFDLAETGAFLNQVMQLGLTPGDVDALQSRTEGWIAGLQMAAISLQNRPDPSRFIEAFAGSHRFILDYLLEEVLQRRSLVEQDFLLRTSILEQMCGPLCEVLVPGLSIGEGQAILERLERANLFVLPLDDQRAWYRYHRLFADLLARQLEQRMPDQVQVLQERASAWFEANGLLDFAIDHALVAEDFERASCLIESTAEETLMRSQFSTLSRWVAALPEEHMISHPRLRIYYAWVLLFNGQPIKDIQARLGVLARDPGISPGLLAPLRAYIAVFQGQIPSAIQYARVAIAELPLEDRFLRSTANWIANLEYVISGERQAALQSLEPVIQLSQAVGNVILTVMAMCSMADSYLSLGNLDQAEELYRHAMNLAVDSQGNRLPVSGIAQTRLGEVLHERNELSEAEGVITEGIRHLESWNELGTIAATVSLAQIRQDRGDTSGANALIARAMRLAARFDATTIDDRMAALIQVRLRLAQGDLPFVRDWLENTVSPRVGIGAYETLFLQREQILRARALITVDRPSEAQSLLEPLAAILEREGRKRRLTEVLALVALAYQAMGEKDQAIKSIERAISLAEAGGFIRTIVGEGEAMRVLLMQAARRGIIPGYTHRLIDAFTALPAEKISPEVSTVSEALSQREVDVLNLLAIGMTNQEIAGQLYISLRTVKFHTGNIFSKLGVTNRTQAVARARQLGLLTTP